MRDALDFAFRTLPDLRRDGWEIIETPKWPYRLSPGETALSVMTQTETGEGFHGHGWFSLGFSAEPDLERDRLIRAVPFSLWNATICMSLVPRMYKME